MNGINKDNPTVGECMLQLMEKWVCHDSGTGDLPRTWETVVQALKDTGVEALAQQLAKYAATSTLVSTDLSGSSLATSVHLNLPYFRQKTTGNKLIICLSRNTTSLPSYTDSHSMYVACIYV